MSEPLFDGLDAQKAYEKFLPVALAMPETLVKPFRLTPDLAMYNVGRAMPALLAKKDAITAHFKLVAVQDLLDLPELALATKYAALEAEKGSVEQAPLPALITEGWELRGVLLSSVKSLARSKLIADEEAEAIIAGRGVRDMADDNVDLASLFRKHEAKIAGKHSVTPEQIERAAVVGSTLSAKLRPGQGPTQAAPPSPQVEIRNRMATLLVNRHDLLERVMHYFYGRDYEDKIPPLMSRVVTAKETDETPPV